MSVLSTQTIRGRLYGNCTPESSILISPLLDDDQVKNSAVDIRLGRHFIVTKPFRMATIDPGDRAAVDQIPKYQEKQFVDFGKSLILQPGGTALGSVLEYLALPNDVYAEVMTRSSWGRLDVTIATAVCVHAGYAGCLTLEFENRGHVPVLLYPGSRVGQLIFHGLDQPDESEYTGGKYGTTKPQFSRIHREAEEIERFKEIGRLVRVGNAASS